MLLYITHDSLERCIGHVLQDVDATSRDGPTAVTYINGTLPTKLFEVLESGEYLFKNSDESMKAFNYQKADSVYELKRVVDESSGMVVIEDLHQIVRQTSIENARLNAILIEIFTKIRARSKAMIIDLVYNRFTDLNCDDHITLTRKI